MAGALGLSMRAGLRLGVGAPAKGVLASSGSYRFISRASAGRDATIVACSDSTGASTDRWIYKIAAALPALYPTARVEYYSWNDAGSVYGAANVVAAGSGGPTLKVYNASVSGKQLYYQHGSKFNAAYGVGTIGDADWIIVNHGHNHDYNWPVESHASIMIAGAQQIAKVHPNAGVSIVAQNPLYNSTQGTNRSLGAALAATLMNWDCIDAYTLFNNAGKPAAWYDGDGTDPVHPSITAGGGDDQIFDTLIEPRLTAPTRLSQTRPTLLSKRANLLTNGDFSDWTSSVPESWTATNATAAKDETNFQTGSWAAELTATTTFPSLRQVLTGDAAVALRSKYVTAFCSFRLPAANTSAVTGPDIQSSSNGGSTYSTSIRGWGITTGNGRDGFIFSAATLLVPANTTDLRVQTPGSGMTTGQKIVIDRMVLVEGRLPYDML